jgi:hypothetical protein
MESIEFIGSVELQAGAGHRAQGSWLKTEKPSGRILQDEDSLLSGRI